MQTNFKKLFPLFLIIVLNAHSQYSIQSQQDRLLQYAGNWVSSINPETDSIAEIPQLKMSNKTTANNLSLSVTVEQLQNKKYHFLMQELIGFDKTINNVFASGHDTTGNFFMGKGKFLSQNNWVMQDQDLLGNPTMKVNFDFKNTTDVLLEGFDPKGKSLWKTRYIKNNPKDKKIGVQLVSVHEEMKVKPIETLKQLGRMGYSYIETFVYSEGEFYNMSPEKFKAEVEKTGMQFLGSMTFYDLPNDQNWDKAMEWWKKCIKDHKVAGVSYLSTSNNQIKNIKNKNELKNYCNYYNTIGKLCAENGLKFIFHNHADEFLTIDGVTVYDYFLENTKPEYVYFQSDLYWMHIGGVNPIDYFKKHPKRFISWHVKDYKELGESGKIDFEEIFKYRNQAGLEYVISEVEDYNYPPLYSIEKAWNYLYYNLLEINN